jgi:hypothetical protein
MMTDNLTPAALSHFYGTEGYAWGPFRKFAMTDGVTYVCMNGLSWFVDLIASHQSKARGKLEDFQNWTLKHLTEQGFMAVATCDDGNGNVVVSQKIEYTDFPFDRFPSGFSIYVKLGSLNGKDLCWVALLPSED